MSTMFTKNQMHINWIKSINKGRIGIHLTGITPTHLYFQIKCRWSFCNQWVKVRCDCSFCSYWWIFLKLTAALKESSQFIVLLLRMRTSSSRAYPYLNPLFSRVYNNYFRFHRSYPAVSVLVLYEYRIDHTIKWI